MKKIFGFLGMVALLAAIGSQSVFASEPTPEPYTGEDPHSYVHNAAEEPGAPVAYRSRPGFAAADEAMTTMYTGNFASIKFGKNQNAGPGGAAVATSTSQNLNMPVMSALRYEHTEYEDVKSDSDRIGLTLRAAIDKDYFTLNIAVPIDRVTFDEEFNKFDFTRIGIVATPRLNLMKQDNAPIDLSFGVNAFFFHTFFDKDNAYNDLITTDNSEEDYAQHVGIGPVLSIAKDYNAFSLGFGAIWQNGFNMGGDEEFFDDFGNDRKEELEVAKLGLNVGVPVGDRWFITGSTTYTHVFDNHVDLDSDWFTAALGVTYMVSDKWSLDVQADTDFGADDLDSRIQLSVGAVWEF